jgi:aerobic-type carbon monoxide dehydrogenase small subunit (CoxS/CutS family)
MTPITLVINGKPVSANIEPRTHLADFLREGRDLTGTHLGCEHGVCGACTVQLDGHPVRSCLMFAVQAHGHQVATVEGMAPDDSSLNALQQAFHECHALQCGFCTPGILMTMDAFLREEPDPTPERIRSVLAGNLCRCTGYQNIITAVRLAADRLNC